MGWIPDILGTLANMFRVGRATLDSSSLTSNRTLTLPDASGTLALTSGNASLSATEGVIRHLTALGPVHAGDQCSLSAAGVAAMGRFPLLGTVATAGDDRIANKYIRFASGRILVATAKLHQAAGLGAAVFDTSGLTLLSSLSSNPVDLYRISDTVWYLAGAAILYDDASQEFHPAPATLHHGTVVIGSTLVHDVAGGFGLFDLTLHTALSVTSFPPTGGGEFTTQGWAASGSSVCVVGTIDVTGVLSAYLYEYDLAGNFVRAVALGFTGAVVSIAIHPASVAGDFFVGTSGDGGNGTLWHYAGGVLGSTGQGFGTASDSLALWSFDGAVLGYAMLFRLVDDQTPLTAYWAGSEVAVSSLYDWGNLPPCLLMRSPGGKVFALADDGVPGSGLSLVGISAAVSGSTSAVKQPFAATPEAAGLFLEIASRRRSRTLCERPSFSGTMVSVKGVWGVNGLGKGLAADAYTITESGSDLALASSLTLADAGSADMNTPLYSAYGWRFASDGRLIDLSRSIDGAWHLLDGVSLTITESATVLANDRTVIFVDRVAADAYLIATRTGIRLRATNTLTTGYTVVTTSGPAMLPDPAATGVALTDATSGQAVDVLLWGTADLVIPDGNYACGDQICFVLDNKLTLIGT